MSLVAELVSVETFIKTVYPDSTYEKQTVPLSPVPNTFVIRFQNDSTRSETRFHTVSTIEYQIVYFGANAPDVLEKMRMVRKATLNKRMVIPIADTLRYMRVGSFSFSQPFKTENDMDAIIGVMSVEIREARDQDAFTKIMQVNTKVE